MITGDQLIDASIVERPERPPRNASFQLRQRRHRANSPNSTQANVGKPFAIVLDNKVISAPNDQVEPILGGSAAIISGSFTTEEREQPRHPAALGQAAGAS